MEEHILLASATMYHKCMITLFHSTGCHSRPFIILLIYVTTWNMICDQGLNCFINHPSQFDRSETSLSTNLIHNHEKVFCCPYTALPKWVWLPQLQGWVLPSGNVEKPKRYTEFNQAKVLFSPVRTPSLPVFKLKVDITEILKF